MQLDSTNLGQSDPPLSQSVPSLLLFNCPKNLRGLSSEVHRGGIMPWQREGRAVELTERRSSPEDDAGCPVRLSDRGQADVQALGTKAVSCPEVGRL